MIMLIQLNKNDYFYRNLCSLSFFLRSHFPYFEKYHSFYVLLFHIIYTLFIVIRTFLFAQKSLYFLLMLSNESQCRTKSLKRVPFHLPVIYCTRIYQTYVGFLSYGERCEYPSFLLRQEVNQDSVYLYCLCAFI